MFERTPTVGFANTKMDAALAPSDERTSIIAATDGELLMQFVRHRNQHAFAQIVERHGRLVWMVCRQVLRQQQDVEDAFQATFLILAQRATTIRASDSAAAWLFKVAQRTASAARRRRWRRREEPLSEEWPLGEEALPMICRREMLFVLIEELREMPERYQTPLVLRYLEGCSRRAIAEQTDSTVGQIQARLARGRRMLRSRLVRRGISLSLASAALGAASTAASAAVTPTLIGATATSCLTFTLSGTSGNTSAAALELAKEGAKAMCFASLAKPAVVVTTLLIASGIVLAAQQSDNHTSGVNAIATANQVELETASAGATFPESAEVKLAAAEASGPSAKRASSQEPELNGPNPVVYNLMQVRPMVQQRELEREHWQLKAEGFRLKAQAIQVPGASGPEHGQARAEQLLMLAESKLAEAKALEIETHLEILKQQDGQQVAPGSDSNPALKPGDAIELFLAPEAKTLHLQLDSEGKIEIAPDVARTEVAGVDPRRAEVIIAKVLGRERKQVRVHRVESPASAVFENERTRADAIATTQKPPVLEPNDALRIEVANAFADQPIDGIYVVEAMGTVPLGASYGRVKVGGLSVLEAEEAVKRHLAEFIEDPMVQATLHEKGGTTATAADLVLRARPVDQLGLARPDDLHFQQAVMQELDQLHRQINRLQEQNEELKKQLRQNSVQQSSPR